MPVIWILVLYMYISFKSTIDYRIVIHVIWVLYLKKFREHGECNNSQTCFVAEEKPSVEPKTETRVNGLISKEAEVLPAVSNVTLYANRQAKLQERKLKMATLASAVIENPQESVCIYSTHMLSKGRIISEKPAVISVYIQYIGDL